MVKRTRTTIAREIDKPLINNASTHTIPRSSSTASDDVLVALANAHENKRARQVTEWERAQSIYVRQAV